MALHFNNETFEQAIAGDKPVLVDFWATWCGPCMKLTAELEELAANHPEIIVGKLNIEENDNTQIAVSLGVTSIPALFFYRNGELVKQLTGYMKAAELANKLGL